MTSIGQGPSVPFAPVPAAGSPENASGNAAPAPLRMALTPTGQPPAAAQPSQTQQQLIDFHKTPPVVNKYGMSIEQITAALRDEEKATGNYSIGKVKGKFAIENGTDIAATTYARKSDNADCFAFDVTWEITLKDDSGNEIKPPLKVTQRIYTSVKVPDASQADKMEDAKLRAYRLAKSFELVTKMAYSDSAESSQELQAIRAQLQSSNYVKFVAKDDQYNFTALLGRASTHLNLERHSKLTDRTRKIFEKNNLPVKGVNKLQKMQMQRIVFARDTKNNYAEFEAAYIEKRKPKSDQPGYANFLLEKNRKNFEQFTKLENDRDPQRALKLAQMAKIKDESISEENLIKASGYDNVYAALEKAKNLNKEMEYNLGLISELNIPKSKELTQKINEQTTEISRIKQYITDIEQLKSKLEEIRNGTLVVDLTDFDVSEPVDDHLKASSKAQRAASVENDDSSDAGFQTPRSSYSSDDEYFDSLDDANVDPNFLDNGANRGSQDSVVTPASSARSSLSSNDKPTVDSASNTDDEADAFEDASDTGFETPPEVPKESTLSNPEEATDGEVSPYEPGNTRKNPFNSTHL